MKFTCDRNALNEAINIVSKAASQKSTIPALEGIQISTLQDGVVQLSAYDLSVSITYDLEAEDTKKGIAVLSSKLFGEIIRKLPSCPVTVEIDNKTYLTTIDGGNAHFTITGMSDENFPELRTFSRRTASFLPITISGQWCGRPSLPFPSPI